MYRLSAFYFARSASDLPFEATPSIFVFIIYFMVSCFSLVLPQFGPLSSLLSFFACVSPVLPVMPQLKGNVVLRMSTLASPIWDQ